MKVDDRFAIRGRGDVVSMVIEKAVRRPRDTVDAMEGRLVGHTHNLFLRRLSDGREWKVRGVERFLKMSDLPMLLVGERVGIFVGEAGDLAAGDEVELVEREPA